MIQIVMVSTVLMLSLSSSKTSYTLDRSSQPLSVMSRPSARDEINDELNDKVRNEEKMDVSLSQESRETLEPLIIPNTMLQKYIMRRVGEETQSGRIVSTLINHSRQQRSPHIFQVLRVNKTFWACRINPYGYSTHDYKEILSISNTRPTEALEYSRQSEMPLHILAKIKRNFDGFPVQRTNSDDSVLGKPNKTQSEFIHSSAESVNSVLKNKSVYMKSLQKSKVKRSLENENTPDRDVKHRESFSDKRENVALVVADPERRITGSDALRNTTSSGRGQRLRRGRRRQHRQSKDLALWIDEKQVKLVSGYMMEIFAIYDGRVLPYILDPNFEKHLPVIPYEVQNVNFTWQAGRKRYFYTFDRLYSHDRNILEDPVVSLPHQGRIPKKPKVFTVIINCTSSASGITGFDIGLLIQTRRGKPLPGTPLRLTLRKECTQPSPDPECDEKCQNGGVCDVGRRCQCPEGYMGQFCNTALCYPQCMNGGTCTTPGRCTCPPGYQGRHCEGGICRHKCENGGKCVQKDTCSCPRGYYGNRCEFSKCVIPCVNGGRCRNVNKCRCPHGYAGDHCEIVTGRSFGASSLARCTKKCRHGSCRGTSCLCLQGFTGRWCRRRSGTRRPVWL